MSGLCHFLPSFVWVWLCIQNFSMSQTFSKFFWNIEKVWDIQNFCHSQIPKNEDKNNRVPTFFYVKIFRWTQLLFRKSFAGMYNCGSMEFEMELQKYFGPIVLLLSKTSSSEHYLKLFTIGVCEQAGLKIGCWESPKSPHCTVYSLTSRTVGQIPKKCKETSNLIWLSLIWFIFVLFAFAFACWILSWHNSKPQNYVSFCFTKTLNQAFYMTLTFDWGFFTLLVALAHGVPFRPCQMPVDSPFKKAWRSSLI